MKWREQPLTGYSGGNLILDRDDYVISYQPHGEDYGGDGEETALIITNAYFILNGDYRTEYELCTSLDEAKEVFRRHIDKKSFWSADPSGIEPDSVASASRR